MKLLILAALLAVVQAAPPVPRKVADAPARKSQQQANNTKSDKSPAVPTPVQAAPRTDSQQGDGSSVKPSNEQQHTVTVSKLPPVAVTRDWVDYTAWGFTAILALVGGIGVSYAYKTVRAVEKQGDLIIASERAWISIKTDMEGFNPTHNPHHFHWRIQNTGKSVAVLISTDARCLVWDGHDTLPDFSEFDNTTQIKFKGRILAPNDSYPLHGYFEDWKNGEYSMHDMNVPLDAEPDSLWLLSFGRVRYQTLGQDCESNFVEDYTWVKSEPIPANGFRPRLQAPTAYTKHT